MPIVKKVLKKVVNINNHSKFLHGVLILQEAKNNIQHEKYLQPDKKSTFKG